MEYFENLVNYFYDHIYDPYFTNEYQYNCNHNVTNIDEKDVDKFIQNTIHEMKIEQDMKELERRMIELKEPINYQEDQDDDQDDNNDNALKVKKRKKILCKEK